MSLLLPQLSHGPRRARVDPADRAIERFGNDSFFPFFIHRDGRFVFVNRAWQELTGLSARDLRARPSSRLLSPEFLAALAAAGDPTTRPPVGPVTYRDADGRQRWARVAAGPLSYRGEAATWAMPVDVTAAHLETAGSRSELDYLSRHDRLTGLLDRGELVRRFDRDLAPSTAGAPPAAMIALDLDHFDRINQTWGHQAGDRLVVEVAELVRSLVGEGMVARTGDDEIAIVPAAGTLDEARALVERLRAALAGTRFRCNGSQVAMRANIGLAAAGGCAEETLAAARRACSAARAVGGDSVHESDLDDTVVSTHAGEVDWTLRIEDALAEKRLRLYFQPIVPTADAADAADASAGAAGAGPPVGELLVRLLERDGTVVPAHRFVGAAERSNLFRPIDEWVLETALAAQREARRSGVEPPVFSLNLSARAFADDGFLAAVCERLDRGGVDATRLWFEITETAAIRYPGRAGGFIARLRDRGCRVGLDDFGSGYNSLTGLRDLSLDFIKIDGELVRRMREGAANRAIVAAIHRLGHGMGLFTVAECVEDEETLSIARALGIDHVQGFHLGSPRPLIHDV